MPVISRFNDIVIKMYFRQKEHNLPHIHVLNGDYFGVFLLENENMIQGDLPVKSQMLVKRFIRKYRSELMMMWETQELKVLPPI